MATKIKNIVVLDCTWFQTDQIIEQMQLKGYRNFIKLEGYESVFWRYNHYGEAALSSAESLMFFFREYQAQLKEEPGRYDQIMLLYALNMLKVEKSMKEWFSHSCCEQSIIISPSNCLHQPVLNHYTTCRSPLRPGILTWKKELSIILQLVRTRRSKTRQNCPLFSLLHCGSVYRKRDNIPYFRSKKGHWAFHLPTIAFSLYIL